VPLDALPGWIDRRLTRSGPGARRQDVLLGVGLVGAFSVLVLGTSAALRLDVATVWTTATVAGVIAAADLGLVLLPWRRLPRRALLAFPVLLVAGQVALAVLTTGMATDYTGLLTLAFFYVGLTQPRGTGPVFALLAGPGWVLSQSRWTAGGGIRLFLTLSIWLLLSDVLAVRTARGRAKTEALIAQANTDVLTGLGSRLLLSDRIERLGQNPGSSGSALLLIDLDGFTTINDTFGHAAGDELLVAMAERVASTVRDADVAVRLQGDEFAVLLEDAPLETATRIANRLLSVLCGPISLSRGRVAVTASIGIVEIVPPTTADRVLQNADLATYEAKAAGRNRLSVYDHAMQVKTTERLALETELLDSLEADQFEVHYQPVIHMGTGAITGAEALLRWRHPRRGLLLPGEFLVTSEELGLMEPLGEWILRQACHQAVQWQSIDPARAFTVAVNLSAPEMFAADLSKRVERVLDDTGLPGRLLVLEITERVIMADAALARRRLEELRRLGVRIAIDDFGTGYSSLAYLRELPIDILKVDRSFITPLGSDHQALALLRSIIAIADSFLLDVIVEGVETAAQVEILGEIGCHIAQGFYFGRPATAVEFGDRLTRDQALRSCLGR